MSNLSKFGLGNSEIFLDSKDFKNGELDKLYPKKDTILLSKDGSVGIAYCVMQDLECVSSGAILHLRIEDSKILPQYLTLVLNSLFVKLQAERDCGGSIIEHWRVEEIEKVLIPVLPFKIQKDIEELITKSFELKDKATKLLQDAKIKVEKQIEQKTI
ncbi:restriction endonuclease subunit S [Helicobacter burdigaliensis]|uniref:restriction endonuclease subunit S n=1 Tax=Helicobacter burdigaliensis TaxID=2315334 RepID=UPI000EF64E71|nr:restriction endonuclease subunit S [Helicobacter burdigaliensis]